jgi:lipid II:glycine glycyltransferase (peptidoglycan interpeptide bridge formation enzyme)
MNSTTTELKAEIWKSLDLMRTLRDEVRVKLHLASLDAKDEWNALEPQLARLEQSASELTEATHKALCSAVQRLGKIRKSLS